MSGTVGSDLFVLFYEYGTKFTFLNLDYRSFNSEDGITFSNLAVTKETNLDFTEVSPV